MAKLRIRADLVFDDGDPKAGETMENLTSLASDLRLVELPEGRIERPYVELHRCFHDEQDPVLCEALERWEKQ